MESSKIELCDAKLIEKHVSFDPSPPVSMPVAVVNTTAVAEFVPAVQAQAGGMFDYLPNSLSYSSESLYFVLFLLVISTLLYFGSWR
jgi:hypothetical protein